MTRLRTGREPMKRVSCTSRARVEAIPLLQARGGPAAGRARRGRRCPSPPLRPSSGRAAPSRFGPRAPCPLAPPPRPAPAHPPPPQEEILELEARIEEARRRAWSTHFTPSWFVFFKSQAAAALAASTQIYGEDTAKFQARAGGGGRHVAGAGGWRGLALARPRVSPRAWAHATSPPPPPPRRRAAPRRCTPRPAPRRSTGSTCG